MDKRNFIKAGAALAGVTALPHGLVFAQAAPSRVPMSESSTPSGGAGGALRPLIMGGCAAGFNWLPIFVGQREGFFARAGFEVEVRRLGTVDKATAAVKAGEVHIAITPPEGAIRDAVGGGRLRLIAGNVNRLPLKRCRKAPLNAATTDTAQFRWC